MEANSHAHNIRFEPAMVIRVLAGLVVAFAIAGLVVIPGLGVITIVFLPLFATGWIALEVAMRGRPGDDELQLTMSHQQLLGPGGPDDPFIHADGDDR